MKCILHLPFLLMGGGVITAVLLLMLSIVHSTTFAEPKYESSEVHRQLQSNVFSTEQEQDLPESQSNVLVLPSNIFASPFSADEWFFNSW